MRHQRKPVAMWLFTGSGSEAPLPSLMARGRNPDTVIQEAEKQKKGKYLHACLERRRNFTPLVYSADG
eukprot:5448278-Ditylum_brightwellii.AAC.1